MNSFSPEPRQPGTRAPESEPPAPQPELTPEQQPETLPERQGEERPEQVEVQPLPTTQATPLPAAPSAPTPPKEETLVQLETILSHNLSDIFVQMTPAQQETFRKEGEETAQKIKTLLQSARAKTKKVLKLIRDWLKTIPGVNNFFLEQEAKIKTDKVMEMAEEQKKNRLNMGS